MAERQPEETGLAPEETNDFIAPELEDVYVDEVKLQVKNTMGKSPDNVEEAVQQNFRLATVTAQRMSVPCYTIP